MFCIDLYLIKKDYPAKCFSIHCVNTSGLKLNSEKGISIQCFRRRPQQVSLRPLHCDVECFDCDKWKSQTIFISNLPVNVPRSYLAFYAVSAIFRPYNSGIILDKKETFCSIYVQMICVLYYIQWTHRNNLFVLIYFSVVQIPWAMIV